MTSATPMSETFTTVASEAELEQVAEALRGRGFEAHITPDGQRARLLVAGLIPSDAAVLTAASDTLRATGIAADIDESGKFDAIRPRLMALDYRTQANERRRLISIPDVIVGSVQAITSDGRVVMASATGTQLAAYAYGAGRIIWVVGAQKIVPDLDAAFRRVAEHCLPLEDERARKTYGQPSAISKMLIVDREVYPGRITVVLVNEALGF
jgi:LUD domain